MNKLWTDRAIQKDRMTNSGLVARPGRPRRLLAAALMALCASATTVSPALAQNEPPVCGDCCGIPPAVSGFTAPVTVGTLGIAGDASFVVHVFEVGGCTTQAPGPWANPPAYRHPDWTRAKLGSIFGVTLDDAGNIYVAHSGIYFFDAVGTVGGGGMGAIYKLDSATGAPSLFCTLPNTGPGIGNLTYSCAHDCIYATNFEDGRIYRISMSGVLLETYNFAAQAIQSAAALSSDPAGIAPWGERTWAVAVNGDRLYFSVVRADMSYFPSMPGAPPGPPYPLPAPFNEVWSIPLNPGTGAFAGAVSTLEISVPYCNVGIVSPHNVPLPPGVLSNPVADIAFDTDCCMYLAERTMNGPDESGAHSSRLLKYCREGAEWMPSSDLFEIGQTSCPQISTSAPNSCAGGVGLEPNTCNLVWATGDYLEMPWCNGPGWYYGMSGMPTTGALNPQGLHIDMNGNTGIYDKWYVGSVEVACKVPDECDANIVAKCHLGPDGLPDGQYELSITLHNGMENAAANLLLLPDLGTFVHLNPPLAPGADTKVVVITDQFTPGIHTMDIGLFDSNCPSCHCCGIIGVEFEIPDCYCMLLEEMEVTCHSDGDPSTYWYDASFILRNISPAIARHLFIVPQDLTVTTAPQYVQLPFLLPGQTFPIAFTIQFPGPPPIGADGMWHTTLSLAMFQANFNLCCKLLVEFSGPRDCPSPILGDLNHDMVVDGADLGILLGSWGATPLAGDPTDLNRDGIVDGGDLGVMLGQWGG